MAKSVFQADAKRQGDTSQFRDMEEFPASTAVASPPLEGKLVLPFWKVAGGGRQSGGRLQYLSMETCPDWAQATPWQDLITLPHDTAYRKKQALPPHMAVSFSRLPAQLPCTHGALGLARGTGVF